MVDNLLSPYIDIFVAALVDCSSCEEGAKKMVRVLLRQKHRLVVEKAGLRFLDVRGFTDDSSEIYATKVDNTYRISGRMPPNIGETAWHQFEIEATCP